MARSSDVSFPLSLLRDKSFQLRQIRRVLLLTVFFIVQSTLLLGVFWHNLLGDLVAGNAPLMFASEDIRMLSERVPSTGTVMGKWLVAMLLVNALLTGILCVWILRKLGNPMLAMRRALNEIGDGNLDVRLRTGDAREFSELCVALNRALEEVQGRIRTAQELTRVLDDLDEQPVPDVNKVRKALSECRDVLDFFETEEVVSPDAGDAARAANSDAGGIRRDRHSDKVAAADRTRERDGSGEELPDTGDDAPGGEMRQERSDRWTDGAGEA